MREKTPRKVPEMRFAKIYDRRNNKELSYEEAADILGMSMRTFFRQQNIFTRKDKEMRFERMARGLFNNLEADSEIEQLTKLYEWRHRRLTGVLRLSTFMIIQNCNIVTYHSTTTSTY